VNVTVEPDTVEVNLDVMSVVPEKSFAVVATDPALSATTIAPAVPAVNVGGVGPTGTVLTVSVTVLFASAPSTLKFPAASENLLLATLTTLCVLSAVGVKFAE
jgi:hypothetical protein